MTLNSVREALPIGGHPHHSLPDGACAFARGAETLLISGPLARRAGPVDLIHLIHPQLGEALSVPGHFWLSVQSRCISVEQFSSSGIAPGSTSSGDSIKPSLTPLPPCRHPGRFVDDNRSELSSGQRYAVASPKRSKASGWGGLAHRQQGYADNISRLNTIVHLTAPFIDSDLAFRIAR